MIDKQIHWINFTRKLPVHSLHQAHIIRYLPTGTINGWSSRIEMPLVTPVLLGETFRTRPDRPWGPPSLLYNGYRVFPGVKAAGAWRGVDHPPYLAPRLKKE